MNSNTEVYILIEYDGGCMGVFNSEEALKPAVDLLIARYPKIILSYQTYEMNDPAGLEWDWCYIPKDTDLEKLKQGGGVVPSGKFLGQNLVGVSYNYKD